MLRRISFLFAVSLSLAAGTGQAETLNQALVAAWQHNPRLQAARASHSAARSDLEAARSGWHPSIGLNAQLSAAHTSGDISFFDPPSHYDAGLRQTSINLQISQPLYHGGRLSSRISARRNSASASRAQTHALGSKLFLNTVKVYLNVITSRKLVQVQKHNVQVIKQQLQAARTALQHGEGTKTDVAQANSRLQAAIAQRIRAQAAVAHMEALYRTVVGHPPGPLSVPTRLPPLPQNLADAKLLASQNYRVRAAQFTARAASDRAEVASAATRPSVDLFARLVRKREPQYGFDALDDQVIGLSLSFPIWSGGTLRAKTAAARHRADAARLQATATKNRARQRVVTAWHNYGAAQAAFGADQARLRAARTAASGVAAEHQQGERTLLDVLNAEQAVRDAKAALIQARRDRIVAGYSLFAATGQLSAARLGFLQDKHPPTTP